MVGSWRLVAAGGWRRLVAGGWWRLVVGGWWRLAVDGSWRLAVGGPLGLSLRAVLSKKKKKISFLKDAPAGGPLGAHGLLWAVPLTTNCCPETPRVGGPQYGQVAVSAQGSGRACPATVIAFCPSCQRVACPLSVRRTDVHPSTLPPLAALAFWALLG